MIVIVQRLMDDCLMCLYESEYYEVVTLADVTIYYDVCKPGMHTCTYRDMSFSVLAVPILVL